MKNNKLGTILACAIVLLFSLGTQFQLFRWDVTSEKRYSVSENTQELMEQLKGEYDVKIYLDGDLSAGFLRLRKSTKEMLEEFQAYSDAGINIIFENPTQGKDEEAQNKHYEELEQKGLRILLDNEDKNDEGQRIERLVCPWVTVSQRSSENKKTRSVNVCLYKEQDGASREECLVNSEANLEYALTDAFRQLANTKVSKIAFIEGHGEKPDALTYDIEKELSHYYQIDKGQPGNCPDSLFSYKAIIVAGPTSSFSEVEKFVLDQYIMNGGKVLWLIDGVRISLDSLRTQSATIGIANDVNLQDMLFRYGARIEPVLVQDVQCVKAPVNTARENEAPKWKPMPWYYSPLLLTAPNHPITKNVTPVKSEFTSGINFVGKDDKDVKKYILLVTSTSSHVQQMPGMVSMNIVNVEQNGQYFNAANIPVAVAMEGHFTSVYKNRMIPKGVYTDQMFSDKSYTTKMIIVANSSVICNEVTPGQNGGMNIVPLGYDRYEGRQYGNKDFILNCVNYLTDDKGWMDLRARELQLRLLNVPATKMKTFWKSVNIFFPLIVLGLFGAAFLFIRKKKYGVKKTA
ncbi:MAG: gliding motility-associated ABC transporter substrate-binding protein GldG [Paludibacteraceae bacterium]|nr:gliding motility-associated ABC transporter substrate-binding protein GldG [Paludibacteraceae bacterium]